MSGRKEIAFEKGNEIGSGGFGQVFHARRIDDDAPCVLKYLKSPYTSEALRRFKREVRMSIQMAHPNIVPVLGTNLEADPPFFAMPQAAMNLREYLRSSSGEDQLEVFDQIATGIQYAHKNRVIHRDLKPENVLVFNTSASKPLFAVGDFGLGKDMDRTTTSLTQINARMGTFEYAAPEQWGNANTVTELADIFALGKLLYEILTGELPYPFMNLDQLPRKYVYIVQRATNQDPGRRYQSVKELRDAIAFVNTDPRIFARPAEHLQSLSKSLMEQGDLSTAATNSLAEFLCNNSDDYPMLVNGLPRLPDPILEALNRDHSTTFAHILNEYDNQIANGVTFEYCDIVANFYSKIFYLTAEDELKQLVLKRLIQIGHENNRWYVGNVTARLIAEIDDPSMIQFVRDELLRCSKGKAFLEKNLRQQTLPAAIRDIL